MRYVTIAGVILLCGLLWMLERFTNPVPGFVCSCGHDQERGK